MSLYLFCNNPKELLLRNNLYLLIPFPHPLQTEKLCAFPFLGWAQDVPTTCLTRVPDSGSEYTVMGIAQYLFNRQ